MLKTKNLVLTALIAAAYAVCTIFLAPISFGTLQFRVAEVLTVLPVFTPFAIPGLTIGCFIANMFSPLGIIDMIFGSIATLIAAYLSYKTRHILFKNLPILSLCFPVISNGIIIGAALSITAQLNVIGFLLSALSIMLSEALSCYILGIPFYIAIKPIMKNFK